MPAIGSTDSGLQARTKINAAIAATEALLKQNYAATAAPTSTDDSAAGYAVGSTWLIPGTGEMWRARSVTANAARWVKVDTADFDTFIAGRYYIPFGVNPLNAGSPSTAGVLRLFYGIIKQRVTIDLLAFRTTAAGANAQLGIYRSVGGTPSGTPVAKTATFASASAAVFAAALDAGSVTLEPGPYWFASQVDVQTNCIILAAGPSASTLVGALAALDVLHGAPAQGLAVNNTFGTWPDLTGVTPTVIAGNVVIPAISFRVASVP